MAKKMLSIEEIETQMVLELPDRQVMRIYKDITIGTTVGRSESLGRDFSPGKE